MSVTIEVTLSLPVPVVLPAVHGNMRRMRAESVRVRRGYGRSASVDLWGPCLRADGSRAVRACTGYSVGEFSPSLDLLPSRWRGAEGMPPGLPERDRAVIDTALCAWWDACDAAEEALVARGCEEAS